MRHAVETANPPAVKRARENDGGTADTRNGPKRKQLQPPSSFSALATGVGINNTTQSSLLLCLHALTHCTEQLRQQDTPAGNEDAQLLSDIATAAGRVQRLARQRLQTLTSADTAQQPTDEQNQVPQQTTQQLQQHMPSTQEPAAQETSRKAPTACGPAATLQQHEGQLSLQSTKQQLTAGKSPNSKHGRQQQTNNQRKQQQSSQQDNIIHIAAANQAPLSHGLSQQQQPTQHAADTQRPLSGSQRDAGSSKQQTASTGVLKLPPAPTTRQLAAPLQKQTAAGKWLEDKRPYKFQSAGDASGTFTIDAGNSSRDPHGTKRHIDTSSRAAAALEAALAAAAADASKLAAAHGSSGSQQRPGSDRSQTVAHDDKGAAKAPPTVGHLPALNPVGQLHRDRLKSLANQITHSTAVTAGGAGSSSNNGDVVAAATAAAVAREKGGARPSAPGSLPSSKMPVNGISLGAAAAAATDSLSSDSGGAGTSSDSSSSSDDGDDGSSSESDSDRELPVTQLQEKLTPARQQQQNSKANTPPPAAAVAVDGPQQCLVCRNTYPADKLITSKLFSSCKHCLTAAVARGSSRGFRLAHCPKRGCNAMVIKLGKSGWHTGDSGQAHYVEIDSKTGLFRIRYSKKVTRKKKQGGKSRVGTGSVKKRKAGKQKVSTQK